MKILLITSNSRRHVYLANKLATHFETMVVTETQPIEVGKKKVQKIALGSFVQQHFECIAQSEIEIFGDEKRIFKPGALLALSLGDINHQDVLKATKDFNPNIAIVFGSSWIKNSLLKYLQQIPTFNLHMGISPYYRGHSTNFWAFYERKPELVGGTILKINKELDKGDIICHVRPLINENDNYYLFSMRAVLETVHCVFELAKSYCAGNAIQTMTQFEPEFEGKYFTSSMFTEQIAEDFIKKQDSLMKCAQTILKNVLPLSEVI